MNTEEKGMLSVLTINHNNSEISFLENFSFSKNNLELAINSLKEIKADSIRNNFSKQTSSFLDGLGKDYKNKLLPLAVSPWVILFRNEDSLTLNNKNSWEVVFSSSLTKQIVFPKSPYLLISIA